ncbi:MlaD family protein [Desulfocapsa sulfexigens]|nr:MlaD family protein [Desulfocapsa sulfexigens]
MPNKSIQPVMIGIFVILSLVLFMTAIVIFGGNKFFARENLMITYFEGSLDGLSIGADVTYRGVTIGQVKNINIHIRANGEKSQDIIIPVLISLNADSSLIIEDHGENSKGDINTFMEAMCKQGLRAKLRLKSVVTGKRYIDLGFYENSVAVYQDKTGEYFEIPTLPSEMQQFSKVIGDVNFGELYQKFNSTLTSLEKLSSGLAETLDQKKTQQLLDELLVATGSLNSLLSKLDTEVTPILDKIDGGLEQFNALTGHADNVVSSLNTHIDSTLEHADALLAQAENTIRPNSPLYHRLTEAMQQLEKTAKSLETLSNFIHRNPDTLIFGLQNPGKAEHNE